LCLTSTVFGAAWIGGLKWSVVRTTCVPSDWCFVLLHILFCKGFILFYAYAFQYRCYHY